MASWYVIGFELTPTTPWSRTSASNSPETRWPRRMKSSQTLWPSAKRRSARLLMIVSFLRRRRHAVATAGPAAGSSRSAPDGLRQTQQSSLGVAQHRGAVTPGHVGRWLFEDHALGDQRLVGAIHVRDDEVDGRLARRPPLLRRPGERRHEAQARAGSGADEQVVEPRLVIAVGEAQHLGVEALALRHVAAAVVGVVGDHPDGAGHGPRGGRRL